MIATTKPLTYSSKEWVHRQENRKTRLARYLEKAYSTAGCTLPDGDSKVLDDATLFAKTKLPWQPENGVGFTQTTCDSLFSSQNRNNPTPSG